MGNAYFKGKLSEEGHLLSFLLNFEYFREDLYQNLTSQAFREISLYFHCFRRGAR